MSVTIGYFYRKTSTAIFEQYKGERSIVPVRLKSPFSDRNSYYSFGEEKWIDFDGNTDSLSSFFRGDFLPAEYADNPEEPEGFAFNVDPVAAFLNKDAGSHIEDLDAGQMKAYLEKRTLLQKFRYDTENYTDSRGIEKNCYGVKIEADEEKLTLKITVLEFSREGPDLVEESVLYDIKDGRVDINLSGASLFYAEIDDEGGVKEPAMRYSCDKKALELLNGRKIPRRASQFAFDIFLDLAESFWGISYDTYRDYGGNLLQKMYDMTMIPYEPCLYPVLMDRRFTRKFRYRRTDSKVFKRFCRKMRIRNTKFLRKLYLERPEVLITCMNIKACGFKDVNIYYRVLKKPYFCRIFDSIQLSHLAFFSRWCIKNRGELSAMNILLKESDDWVEKSDAISMFAENFRHIPKTLRNDILKDGLTTFNHDALSNVDSEVRNKNYTFSYSRSQKRLEDNIGGYEFRLPADSSQLREIGSALHNCVASYSDNVRKKVSTIVYARKDGDYKICIEVRGKEIFQERSDHNKSPSEEERKILDQWHLRHGLVQGN